MNARYRYRTVYVHLLREGDEIKSADGKTWLPAIRGVKPEQSKRWGAGLIYHVWTEKCPGHYPADITSYTGSQFKIRRAAA